MSAFLTPFVIEEIGDGSNNGRGTWQLGADLDYQSDELGMVLKCPKGMVTDLDSIPRLPIVYFLTNGYARKAAIPHDVLYGNHAVSRAKADAVLREACIVCGVPAWRAWLIWSGVRVGGAGPWSRAGQPQTDEEAAAIIDSGAMTLDAG